MMTQITEPSIKNARRVTNNDIYVVLVSLVCMYVLMTRPSTDHIVMR